MMRKKIVKKVVKKQPVRRKIRHVRPRSAEQAYNSPPAGWVVDPIQHGQAKYENSKQVGYYAAPTKLQGEMWIDQATGAVYVPQTKTVSATFTAMKAVEAQKTPAQQAADLAAREAKYGSNERVIQNFGDNSNTIVRLSSKDVSDIESGKSIYINPVGSTWSKTPVETINGKSYGGRDYLTDGKNVVISNKKENENAIELNKSNFGGADVRQSYIDISPNGEISLGGVTRDNKQFDYRAVYDPVVTKKTNEWNTTVAAVKKPEYIKILDENEVIYENPFDMQRAAAGQKILGKVYYAPRIQDAEQKANNVSTYDLSKKVEITDEGLKSAFALKGQYGNTWKDIVGADYQTKTNYDSALREYNAQKQIALGKEQDAMVEAGMLIRDPKNKNGLMENPAYTDYKLQQEAAKQGSVYVKSVDGAPMFISNSTYNAISADPDDWAKNNQGSLAIDLGITPKPFAQRVYELSKDDKQTFESSLYSAWKELRTGDCFTVFKNKYIGDPTGYVNELYQRDVNAFNYRKAEVDRLEKQFIVNGEWVGSEADYKVYQDNLNWLAATKNNADRRVSIYNTLPTARKQRYNKPPRTTKKRGSVGNAMSVKVDKFLNATKPKSKKRCVQKKARKNPFLL